MNFSLAHRPCIMRCMAGISSSSTPTRNVAAAAAPARAQHGKQGSRPDNSRSSSSSSNRNSSRPQKAAESSRSGNRGSGSNSGSRSSHSSNTARPAAPADARSILLKRRPAATIPPTPAAAAAAANAKSPISPPAAAAAAAAASLSEELLTDPTFVPRDPAVKDGPWNAVDAGLVVAAQRDADLVTTPDVIDAQGFVLLGTTPEQLSNLAQQLGQPAYRGKQLADGILKGARNVNDIKGLPAGFREQLQGLGVKTGRSVVHQEVVAPDGTRKLLLQLEEGRVVETVGIPVDDENKKRLTVCVSSQVGCPMRCTFCATGKGGFARNLKPHEIIDQVMTIAETYDQRVSNVVFMGMGEPLLNLSGVVAAVNFLKDQLGMSGRAITISTVGVPNAIARLAQHKLTATLAVSIHAPNQTLREQLIPSAKVYPIQALMQDCSSYFKVTGRRVTFEYTLMAGTNDAPEHAQELADLLRRHNLMSHVNLIPWNPVDESDYRRPSRNSVMAFQRVLEAAGLPVSVRSTRGLEAAAACGQLRNRFQKQGLENPAQLL